MTNKSLIMKNNLSDPVSPQREKLLKLKNLVDIQGQDESIWCKPIYIIECHLQKELRKLHAAVEDFLEEIQ